MFEKELSYIESEKIRSMVESVLEIVPSYFYHVPASSSGKYHPQYALGDGGLYRHVKAAIIIANELFRMERFSFSRTEKDLIIASLILHDCWKQGWDAEGHTRFDHPMIAVDEIFRKLKHDSRSLREIWYAILIAYNVASHMGQWNTSKDSKKKLPKPTTKMQKFVHLCDFIASRRPLEVALE